jgi:hypothetical protein
MADRSDQSKTDEDARLAVNVRQCARAAEIMAQATAVFRIKCENGQFEAAESHRTDAHAALDSWLDGISDANRILKQLKD